MTYNNERDTVSDDFNDWFELIESDSDEEEDVKISEEVQEFLNELEETIPKLNNPS